MRKVMNCRESSDPASPLPEPTEISELDLILLEPAPPLGDFEQARSLAQQQADQALGENRLLSWYDRDRDTESPQPASGSFQGGGMPGYVVYAICHGAKLQVDIHAGRFVFFFLPLGES